MGLQNSAQNRPELSGSAASHSQSESIPGEWLESTIERFAGRLERDGLHTALGYLNSRTRFRYTGAYRLSPPLLCSIGIFDRENPALSLRAEVEMSTTYCSIVGATGRALAVEHAATDPRVRTHPAREQFAAYCGVPLIGPAGEAFGTLCHYDARPRIGTADHLELMHRVAPLVASYVLSREG